MSQNRLATKVLVAVGVAIAVGALTPTTRAQGLDVKSDDVKINFGTADFGNPPHVFGSPENSGFVNWNFSTVNGSVRAEARVIGLLYLDSLDPGCARLTIDFKSSSGAILATRNRDVCVTQTGHSAADSTNWRFIQEVFGSSDLNRVVLRTHSVVNGQIVSTSPPMTSNAPNVKKHDVIVNSDNADFGKGIAVRGEGSMIDIQFEKRS